MSQAGVFVSSGGGGGIDTVAAGLGISVSTVGSTATVTNTGAIKYISPSIDFKTVGLTTFFTTESTLNFFIISVIVIVDSSTAANLDGTFNIGWTATDYDDLGNTLGDVWSSSQTYSLILGTLNPIFIPASTTIRVNVTSGDTGTTQIARIALTGFYG